MANNFDSSSFLNNAFLSDPRYHQLSWRKQQPGLQPRGHAVFQPSNFGNFKLVEDFFEDIMPTFSSETISLIMNGRPLHQQLPKSRLEIDISYSTQLQQFFLQIWSQKPYGSELVLSQFFLYDMHQGTYTKNLLFKSSFSPELSNHNIAVYPFTFNTDTFSNRSQLPFPSNYGTYKIEMLLFSINRNLLT